MRLLRVKVWQNKAERERQRERQGERDRERERDRYGESAQSCSQCTG